MIGCPVRPTGNEVTQPCERSDRGPRKGVHGPLDCPLVCTFGHWRGHSDPDQSEAADDLKPPASPMPTRAWVSPLDLDGSPAVEMKCLVEEFPGDHFEQYGKYLELLHWAALDRDARDFFVWNVEQQDWDRPSRTEVLRRVQSPTSPT